MERNLHNSQILDGIFIKIEEEARIIIEFSVCMPDPGTACDQDFIIKAVNGQKQAVEFYNKVYFLCTEALHFTMNDCRESSKQVALSLLSEMKQRFLALKKVTRRVGQSIPEEEKPGLFVFNYPEFRPENGANLPKYALDRVLKLCMDYALVWYIVVNEFVGKIEYLSSSIEYGNWMPDDSHLQEEQPKLPVKQTVSQFAVFMRACKELGLLEVTSVAELCRIVTSLFRTARTSYISAKSFRNHMEVPSIEDIDFTIENLQHIIHYLRLLKKKLDK